MSGRTELNEGNAFGINLLKNVPLRIFLEYELYLRFLSGLIIPRFRNPL